MLCIIGLNASPFLLNATLRHQLSKFKDKDTFSQETGRKLLVDDLVSREDDTGKAFTLYKGSNASG